MPKSFLVRKKTCVQSRSWEDVATPVAVPGDTVDTKPLPTPKSPEEDTPPPDLEEDRTENHASVPKRVCKSERDTSTTKHKAVKSDFFHFHHPGVNHQLPHNNHSDHHGVPYKSHHEVFRREYHHPFSHVPMLPTFPPPMLWNSVLHSHAQSPPFLHVHSPPPWLPTPPPTTSPPSSTWMTPPHIAKPSSPVGVLSPAEIPSPSSLATAEEPSSVNSASIPGVPVHQIELSRHSDQSKALLQMPAPCYPMREHVSPYVKNVEIINNGFGIKNPLLTNERQGHTHTDVTTIGQPSGYLLTSETSHTCSLCGFKTDSPRLMQKHLKSHKEIKRFLCTVCCKGFNDTFDLKRHTRTHTGVRPYKCDKCGKAFTQRCSLESHCKKIHGIRFQFAFNERRTKTYVCEECGHSTNDPEEHFVHLRTQHPNNPAILRCHDRRQFKFGRRKSTSLELDEIRVS